MYYNYIYSKYMLCKKRISPRQANPAALDASPAAVGKLFSEQIRTCCLCKQFSGFCCSAKFLTNQNDTKYKTWNIKKYIYKSLTCFQYVLQAYASHWNLDTVQPKAIRIEFRRNRNCCFRTHLNQDCHREEKQTVIPGFKVNECSN